MLNAYEPRIMYRCNYNTLKYYLIKNLAKMGFKFRTYLKFLRVRNHIKVGSLPVCLPPTLSPAILSDMEKGEKVVATSFHARSK